jgi:hypothetical protein
MSLKNIGCSRLNLFCIWKTLSRSLLTVEVKFPLLFRIIRCHANITEEGFFQWNPARIGANAAEFMPLHFADHKTLFIEYFSNIFSCSQRSPIFISIHKTYFTSRTIIRCIAVATGFGKSWSTEFQFCLEHWRVSALLYVVCMIVRWRSSGMYRCVVLVDGYQRLGRTCCFHLHGKKHLFTGSFTWDVTSVLWDCVPDTIN